MLLGHRIANGLIHLKRSAGGERMHEMMADLKREFLNNTE
jgi:hypothetical protein